MKIIFIYSFILLLVATHACSQSTDYPIKNVPFTQVSVTDNFWLPRIKTNHTVTIPASFERCENTGRVKNFEMAAARSGKFCTVYPFDDTDIYKTIEGASFSMSLYPDKKMDSYIDSLIQKIKEAQEPDGYLYTARTIDPMHTHKWAGKERWEKERGLSHELYNSGHLYEAAVAHYLSTGKRSLLNIAIKNADLVCSVFGPDKRHVAPGHEVIEMGLVKLFRITGKSEYLSTAKYFIEERGHFAGYDSTSKDPWKNGAYWQDHLPVKKQKEAIGHAVRAGYLYAAMADVAALTGDKEMLNAIDTIWRNVVSKKLYVQGSIGAVGDGERFGDNFELPNATAYNETCAAIANVYWNYRMFLLHGESKYIDVLEKTLYNGLLSGVGMDGKSFFYTNAMEIKNNFNHVDRETGRSGWFTCSCCPTNVVRLIPSIPGYMYAQKDDKIFVNLFIAGTAEVTLGKNKITIAQRNNYPWQGNLKFIVSPQTTAPFKILIRIPGWAENQAVPSNLYSFETPTKKSVEINVNGKKIPVAVENGYAVIDRVWKQSDQIDVVLPMEVRTVVAAHQVKDDINKVSIQQGPIIYCAEGIDNNGLTSNLILPTTVTLSSEFNSTLLGGINVVKGSAKALVINDTNVTTKDHQFTAIPYYAWAHRGKGEMTVWFPTKIKSVDIISRD
jgi:DUF1680 family protein